MEARAINRYIGSSPRKMRLVIDLIRGKRVDEALRLLHFSPKHAARTAEKVLRSAVSNLQNKDEGARVEPSDMIVKEAYVDGGMTMKRISPAPMGRAYRIRKRSNHVTIVVAAEKKTTRPRATAGTLPRAQAKATKSSAARSGSAKRGSANTEQEDSK